MQVDETRLEDEDDTKIAEEEEAGVCVAKLPSTRHPTQPLLLACKG